MGAKTNQQEYQAEFKEEAVALIHEQGYSVAEAAKSCWAALCISTSIQKYTRLTSRNVVVK